MAQGPYVLGIDFGTESVRVGIFKPDGESVVFASRVYRLEHPRPGWAEQEPDDWWSGLVAACNEAMDRSGVPADAIAGVSVDATAATVVFLDGSGRHLRPAIMWMDVRATDQAKRIERTGDPALKYNGHGPVSAEFGLPKAMWVKDNEPDVYERTTHIADCADWCINRLTGEWTSSINVASAKYYYDRDVGGFPRSLYEAVDAADLLDKLSQDVIDISAQAGELRGDAAEELGLKAGTPVAQGGVDAYMGAVGLGVVKPGAIGLITGSSHVVIGQAAKPIYGRGIWGAYTDAMVPGQYTVEAGQASTGSVVAWFKNRFAGDAAAEAERRGVDTYDVLNEMAAQVPIGSEGLIALDYFQGNRAPHSDPLVRGAIWGLSLSHGPGHVFRAIMEGVCYGTQDVLRNLNDHGFRPTEVIVAGGPTKSALWTQMHADVTNQPLSITRGGDVSPVLGSAMLASVAAGIHGDLEEAAEHMVHVERTVEPDAEAHEAYQFYFDRYVETYERLREPMHKVVQHVSAG